MGAEGVQYHKARFDAASCWVRRCGKSSAEHDKFVRGVLWAHRPHVGGSRALRLVFPYIDGGLKMTINRLALLLVAVLVLTTTGAWAEGSQILAKVGGTPVTSSQVKALLASRGIHQPNQQQMRSGLTLYIERMLLLQRAKEQQFVQNQAGVRQQLRETQMNLVAQAMLQHAAGSQSFSKKRLQQAYQQYVQQLPSEQYRIRAIVVKHKGEAQSVLGALKQGKRFSDLAAEHSLSQYHAAQGGELGWHSPNQLDPLVDRVLVHMKTGQVAGPIWTQQGWWVIQLLQKRTVKKPSLQAVRSKLESNLRAKAQRQYLQSLLKSANIQYQGQHKPAAKPKLRVNKS